MIETKVSMKGMDKEWMWLIIEAKNLGIAKEEIRQFLEKKRVKDLGLL